MRSPTPPHDRPFQIGRVRREVRSALRRASAQRKDDYDKAIQQITRNPFRHPNNPIAIKHLKGEHNCLRRYRTNGDRIIYDVIENLNEIDVLDFGPRGDIY